MTRKTGPIGSFDLKITRVLPNSRRRAKKSSRNTGTGGTVIQTRTSEGITSDAGTDDEEYVPSAKLRTGHRSGATPLVGLCVVVEVDEQHRGHGVVFVEKQYFQHRWFSLQIETTPARSSMRLPSYMVACSPALR